MLSDEKLIPLEKFLVKPGSTIRLATFDTDYTGRHSAKKKRMSYWMRGESTWPKFRISCMLTIATAFSSFSRQWTLQEKTVP
jgi:hypothetical protein